MGLLSFLKRVPGEPRRDPAADSALSAGAAAQARTRARRRLIGATLLLGLGILGFPLLFETQPRPVPVDIPIEIPSKDNAAALPLPPKRATAAPAQALPPVITEGLQDLGRERPASAALAPTAVTPAPAAATVATPAPAVPAAASAAAWATKPKLDARPAAVVAAKPEPQAEAGPDAKPQPKPAAKPEPLAQADSGRFVVQVGAFADADGARQARQKVEKLGLKTYTQEAEVGGAKRIRVRVGPFASREEAAKAAARLKAGGLPGDLLKI